MLGGEHHPYQDENDGAALDLSLIALLIWAGGTAWQIGRRSA